MLTEILLLLATFVLGHYVWHRRTFSYWQRKQVRHIKPTSIFGNFKTVLFGKVSLFEQLSDLHNTPGFENDAVVGIYHAHRPALLIRDLELIKTVTIKQFSDPLGHNNLFFSVFTSDKIKQMYPLMVEIGKRLEAKLSTVQNDSDLIIGDICLRFTTASNDLIDILIAIKHEADSQPRELDCLAAQSAVFQAACFKTTSATMTFALYELAKHQDMQDRLRREISKYFGNEDHISYERIQEMPYLTQVVNETLRKYPIVGYAERECTPPENEPPFVLTPYYDFEVPAGMPMYVATLAIHRDEKYWPEPLKFDPERFAPKNKANLNMDAYMPFGIGSRNRIGSCLGLLQSKLGLVHMLRHHQFSTTNKTATDIVFRPHQPTLVSKTEVHLKVTNLVSQADDKNLCHYFSIFNMSKFKY